MNLADQLRAVARRQPEAPALLAGRRHIGYGELDARVDRAAAAFQRAGHEPGDRVALLLGNVPRFVTALYGALRAGLAVVPLNPGSTASEAAHILAHSGARTVVAGAARLGILDGVRETLPALERVVVTATSAPAMGTRTWDQFTEGSEPPQPVGTGGDDLALLAYTSGTTGRPRGAMLSHANLLANHDQMAATRLRVTCDDIVLCVLPLFHLYALNVALAFPLGQGATVRLVERFDPASTLDLVADGGVTAVVGAPPIYVAWVNLPDAGRRDLSAIRVAVSGAAPLPPAVLQRCRSDLGLEVDEGYGLTETAPVLTTTAMGDGPRAGSVGRPVPGVELRLVDERRRDVRPGDPGEVLVRGPNVFRGYYNDPEATAAALDADGWLSTGDVGVLDGPDLVLVDRRADLIIVSGFNVYPREVEDVLVRHPKVAEAAVVGVAHPYTGETVKAVVVLAAGAEATGEELADFCGRFLARFKCPEVVEFVASLPHNASGKVVRRHLR